MIVCTIIWPQSGVRTIHRKANFEFHDKTLKELVIFTIKKIIKAMLQYLPMNVSWILHLVCVEQYSLIVSIKMKIPFQIFESECF